MSGVLLEQAAGALRPGQFGETQDYKRVASQPSRIEEFREPRITLGERFGARHRFSERLVAVLLAKRCQCGPSVSAQLVVRRGVLREGRRERGELRHIV